MRSLIEWWNRRKKPRVNPESLYRVEWDDERLSCFQPDGTSETVTWKGLTNVAIVTTDQGPFLPDVFWILEAADGRCVIPQGAEGEETLLHRLQELPSFDSGAVAEAMGSAENRTFRCWSRAG